MRKNTVIAGIVRRSCWIFKAPIAFLSAMLVAPTVSQDAALQIIQQAALTLARWANPSFQQPAVAASHSTAVSVAVAAAHEIVGWSEPLNSLQLVFDAVHLSLAASPESNYRPAWALEVVENEACPRIPYPQNQPPSDEELGALKQAIQTELAELGSKLNWENLAQLTLFVEKFGSHLSAGVPDIALIDLARSTAAIAAALSQQPADNQLALIGGDLMGVQKFIYTISSEGALKSLRARSFYLELAAEEIVQRVLIKLDLPRTNIIYAGASKFYLLVPKTEALEQTIKQIQVQFNEWLRKTFQNKVFLAIALESFAAEQLKSELGSPAGTTPLAQIWQAVNGILAKQATRKFAHDLDALLQPQPSHQPCKVCHRDDLPEEKLKPLKDDDDPTLACPTCREMYRLGDRLPDVQAWVRSPQRCDEKDLVIQSVFYRPVITTYKPKLGETVFQINNWELNAYPCDQFAPMLLGKYFRGIANEDCPHQQRFITASEMADVAVGIKRVGYLRMDVDRLSQIFSKVLEANHTLPRLASLSRQMTYFFKVYLNSLAAARGVNFTQQTKADGNARFEFFSPVSDRNNLLFIYAGGDDLFVSGAWNEVVEFAFDVYQSFRAYTGQNPDITLSAGVEIAGAKFPLYQAANEAAEAEDAAKDNGRDSLSMFSEVFSWSHWLGSKEVDEASREYLTAEAMPELLGVLPFVQRLLDPKELGIRYPQSFIRNLLITAQLREQKIQETRQAQPTQLKDVTYFLHLPKLAYAFSRLPPQIKDHENFKPIRQSLMSPRNSPYFRAIATWIELLNRSS